MSREDIIGAGGASRRIAEERVAEPERQAAVPRETPEMAKMLHELMVHQVELEIQNEELIEARNELEANAELLGELYDYAPVGYFSLTANSFIRQLNFMGANMLGRERASVLGKTLTDFICPQSRAAFERFQSRAFIGESPGPCEVTFLRQGLSSVIASLTGALSPNGLVCRVAAMDVTEQRCVEAAVKEKNEDLGRIFNLSNDLLGIAGNDGRFRRVNPAFERVLGHSREVLTGYGFMSFVHPDDQALTQRAMARIKMGEDVIDFTNRYRCADGSYRWLEWRAIPYGDRLMCAVARDITLRKQAEDALRESEAKFRSIVERSPTAMYIYRLDDGGRLILMEVNPAADREIGIKHCGLIGKTLEEAFPNLTDTGIPEMYRAVARGELDTQQFETAYEGGGISGFFEVHVFQTHPGTIAVAFSDISERMKARESRDRTQEELESRVRLRTAQLQDRTLQLRALAGELTHAEERERRRIAGVIHEDLQQMLAAALFHLEMLKPKAADAEARRELTEIDGILRDSIKAARSLTAELSPPVLQQCGLAAALRSLQTWCGEKYGMDVRVSAESRADPDPEVSVAMFQCVRELLFNIVKHAGIRLADLRMYRTRDGLVKIEVADEGAGFDPEEVRAREGAVGGFGLFSIRERMEWLGGGLEIESTPGCGSRFTLWVPLKIVPSAGDQGAPSHSATGSARNAEGGEAGSSGAASGA